MDWHSRFMVQAGWTKAIRSYIFSQAGLKPASRIIDVGCGTGVLEAELEAETRARIFGLDNNPDRLRQARDHTERSHLTCANAQALPFPARIFDVVFCHFLLLWAPNPLHIIQEMTRIARNGGIVAAFAEPDYLGRIDYPEPLAQVAAWQINSLSAQGAHPGFGRQLKAILIEAGLTEVQAGILGAQWGSGEIAQEWSSEWEVIQNDLQYLPDQVPLDQVESLKKIDLESRRKGERILFVPTFYAWGRVE